MPTGSPPAYASQVTRWSCSRSNHAANRSSNVGSSTWWPAFSSVQVRRSVGDGGAIVGRRDPDLGHQRSSCPTVRSGGS